MLSIRFLFHRPIRHFAYYKTNSAAAVERTVEEEFKASVQNIREPLKTEDWTGIRNRVLNSGRFYTKVNVDATILGLCSRHGSLDVGRSYVRFLEQSNIPLTAGIAGKYLKLFSLSPGQVSLHPEQSDEVIRICQGIRDKYPMLDGNTAENLIHALCLTDHWKDSFALLQQVREFGPPSHAAFNDIAQAAFRNRQCGEGVRVLEEGILVGRLPSSASLIAWIENGGNVETLLLFLQRHNLQIPESVATSLKRYLEQTEGIPVTMSSVGRNKTCGGCRTHLDEITIEPEEFSLLQSAFHEKVLIKDNIFIKSTPQEFNEFQRFLDQTGPFDCIIDGLNVAYSVGANRPVNQLSGHVSEYFIPFDLVR